MSPSGGHFFCAFLPIDKSTIMWYNGRPLLIARAGFSVLSSGLRFFVQNAHKRTRVRVSHIRTPVRRPSTSALAGFSAYTALYGIFLLNLAALYARPFSRKPRPHMRHTCSMQRSKSKQKYVKYFFVKLTKYIFKKFDIRFPYVKNVPPDIL